MSVSASCILQRLRKGAPSCNEWEGGYSVRIPTGRSLAVRRCASWAGGQLCPPDRAREAVDRRVLDVLSFFEGLRYSALRVCENRKIERSSSRRVALARARETRLEWCQFERVAHFKKELTILLSGIRPKRTPLPCEDSVWLPHFHEHDSLEVFR